MDSRQYIFTYAIKSLADIPADFEAELSDEPFEGGIFFPQDDPDWFGKIDYPPRILLLQESSLLILSHPSCGESPVRIPLADLHEVEIGRVMLLGWIRFQFNNSSCHLPYNRRASAPVEDFLKRFRRRWLYSTAFLGAAHQAEFGEPLDFKFRNMWSRDIRRNENILIQFFEPSREIYDRFLFFRLRNWKAGDVVAITPSCVIWITDRNENRMELYGGVARFAPLSALQDITLHGDSLSPVLEIRFQHSVRWMIPIYPDFVHAASQFTTAVRDVRTPSQVTEQ